MEDMARFREAMAKPLPLLHRERRADDDADESGRAS
jgi:hypothetical protein